MLKAKTKTSYTWEDGSELKLHEKVIAKSIHRSNEYYFIEVKSFDNDAIQGLYTYVKIENAIPVKVVSNATARFVFDYYTFEKWN